MKMNCFENFKRSGYIVDTEPGKCTLCSECVDICFFGARLIEHEKLILNENLCFGCERCITYCKFDAIKSLTLNGIRIPEDL
jgi:MinD superfamily P-loop ATPase